MMSLTEDETDFWRGYYACKAKDVEPAELPRLVKFQPYPFPRLERHLIRDLIV